MSHGKLLEEASQETVQAEQELADLFDIRRYDTNFLGDILTLIKPKPVMQTKNTMRASDSTSSRMT